MSLDKKVAIVTGAASGIGRACAIKLAEKGAQVAVWDLNLEGAEETVRLIADAGGRAIAQKVDAASRDNIANAAERVRAELGAISILVNNAGITGFSRFMDISEEAWDRMMAINLKGPFLCIQEILPDMLRAKWGRIINISSSSAQSGAAGMTHYSASKGGVMAFTRSLALELAEHGVTVNNIPPGFIETPMLQASPVNIEQAAQASPMKRAGRPEDIANACAFLASEEANYITAQTIGVNGGRNPS